MNDDLLRAIGEYHRKFGELLNSNLMFLKEDKERELAQFITDHVESGKPMTEAEKSDPRFFDMPPDECLWRFRTLKTPKTPYFSPISAFFGIRL